MIGELIFCFHELLLAIIISQKFLSITDNQDLSYSHLVSNMIWILRNTFEIKELKFIFMIVRNFSVEAFYTYQGVQ